MPIHAEAGGFRWGTRGTLYPTRAQAARQARAAYAHGYVGKAGEPPAKVRTEITRRKTKAKHLSELSAGLGLAALGAKAPSYAASVSRRMKRPPKPLGRLADLAPKADSFSEHVVPISLGVGAAGSINFARLQGKEAQVTKRDDRFIRTYRRNISPGAENAYTDLGRRRTRRMVDAGAAGTLSGLAAAQGVGALRAKSRPWLKATGAGLMAVPAVGLAGVAANRIGEARGLQARREKIKARAYERARDDVLGLGRRRRDYPRVEASKAFGVRPGGLMRTASGKMVTRRGALAGTGQYTAGRVPLRRMP